MKTLILLLALTSPLLAEGKKFTLTARASEIDKRTKEHPEIDYVFSRKGKPADNQFASVDTRVKASGYLVIWLMEPKPELFDRLNSYGHHAIQVTYPRDQTEKWQGMKSATPPERFFGFTHTEDTWKYLYTHPVGETGNPVKPEERCRRDF